MKPAAKKLFAFFYALFWAVSSVHAENYSTLAAPLTETTPNSLQKQVSQEEPFFETPGFFWISRTVAEQTGLRDFLNIGKYSLEDLESSTEREEEEVVSVKGEIEDRSESDRFEDGSGDAFDADFGDAEEAEKNKTDRNAFTKSGTDYYEKLFKRPLKRKEQILASHEALEELTQMTETDPEFLKEFQMLILKFEKSALNFMNPYIYQRKAERRNRPKWFWKQNGSYLFSQSRDFQILQKQLATLEYRDSTQSVQTELSDEQKSKIKEALIHQMRWLDLKEMAKALGKIKQKLNVLRSKRFVRTQEKIESFLADKNILQRPEQKSPEELAVLFQLGTEEAKSKVFLTPQQINEPQNIYNHYIGEISFYLTMARISMQANLVRPKMVDEPGHIQLKGVFNPQFKRPEKNDISITPEKPFVGLTGLNAGGKSSLLRAVAFSVLAAHMGLFVPASEAEISWTKHLYGFFPSEEETTSGFSHFTKAISQLLSWTRQATAHDLFLLDEVLTGANEEDLIGLSCVIYEELIQKGVPAITATHIKQAIHYLAEKAPAEIREKVQTWKLKYDIEEGIAVPTYHLAPGIEEDSHGLDILRKNHFPKNFLQLATAIYKNQSMEIKDISLSMEQTRSRGQANRSTNTDRQLEKIARLFPEANFCFPSSEKLEKRLGIKNINEIEHYRLQDYEEYFSPFDFAQNYRELVRYDGSEGFQQDITFLLSRGLSSLEEVSLSLSKIVDHFFNVMALGRFDDEEQVPYKAKDFQQLKQEFNLLIAKIEKLDGNHMLKLFDSDEIIKRINKQLTSAGKGKDRREKVLYLFEKVLPELKDLDFLVGVAKVARKNQWILSEKVSGNVLEMEQGWYPQMEDAAKAVKLDFQSNELQAFVLLGPNASGKTIAFETLAQNIALASLDLPVPAKKFKIGKGITSFAYFGTTDVPGFGRSYFQNLVEYLYSIITTAREGDFVFLDEITGSDQREIEAIQLATLYFLQKKGARVFLNTHLTEALKQYKDVLGIQVYKMDYDWNSRAWKFHFYRTLSPDPQVLTKSRGLEVATFFGFSQEQYGRAIEILKQMKPSLKTSRGNFLSETALLPAA